MLIFSVSFQFLRMTGCDPGSDPISAHSITDKHPHSALSTHHAPRPIPTTALRPFPFPATTHHSPFRASPHSITCTLHCPATTAWPAPHRTARQTNKWNNAVQSQTILPLTLRTATAAQNIRTTHSTKSHQGRSHDAGG